MSHSINKWINDPLFLTIHPKKSSAFWVDYNRLLLENKKNTLFSLLTRTLTEDLKNLSHQEPSYNLLRKFFFETPTIELKTHLNNPKLNLSIYKIKYPSCTSDKISYCDLKKIGDSLHFNLKTSENDNLLSKSPLNFGLESISIKNELVYLSGRIIYDFSIENNFTNKTFKLKFINQNNVDSFGDYTVELFSRSDDFAINDDNTYYGFNCTVPCFDFEFRQGDWYPRIVMTLEESDPYSFDMISSTSEINYFKGTLKEFSKTIVSFNTYARNNRQNQPVITIYKNSIYSKISRELKKIFSNKGLNVGGKARISYWLSLPFFLNKKIILIGERRDTFQDNSSVLFKNIRKQHPKDHVYYLINKNCPDYLLAKKYGNVIPSNSFRHFVYLLHASACINSYDIESYMAPSSYSKKQFLELFGDLVHYKKIFLQHGVTYNNVSHILSQHKRNYDRIITSSTLESEFFIKKFGYSNHNLIKSGMPRFDKLRTHITDTNLKSNYTILLMPTWRRGLSEPTHNVKAKVFKNDVFLNSEYYKFYQELIEDCSLINILEKKNITLKIYPHYELNKKIHLFNNKSKNIIFCDVKSNNVQNLLVDADLLITDYSSVYFDFSFMNKPVIFCHFDNNEFYGNHYKKGYLDIKTANIGTVTHSVSETVNQIEKYSIRNFKTLPIHSKNIQKYLNYPLSTHNHNISETVYLQINILLKES